MRVLRLLAAVGICGLIVTGCASQGPAGTQGAKASVVGTWGEPDKEQQPNLTFEKDGKLSGSDGCNRIFGSWKIDGDEVTVSELGTTQMACEGVDTWLGGMASAKVAGDELTVFDKDGKQIGSLERDD